MSLPPGGTCRQAADLSSSDSLAVRGLQEGGVQAAIWVTVAISKLGCFCSPVLSALGSQSECFACGRKF